MPTVKSVKIKIIIRNVSVYQSVFIAIFIFDHYCPVKFYFVPDGTLFNFVSCILPICCP